MSKGPLDSNAIKALNEMKLEIANELGMPEAFMNKKNTDSVNNIFTAGRVGGIMTRKLVEMGEEELMDD